MHTHEGAYLQKSLKKIKTSMPHQLIRDMCVKLFHESARSFAATWNFVENRSKDLKADPRERLYKEIRGKI